jgi:L-cysteine/cystine lyase
MTFEEARRQFPVLDRFAYLNAGTNGPLARATIEAMEEQIEHDLVGGRSGKKWVDAVLELREGVRAGVAAVIGVEPASLALTDSTTRACAVVLLGLGLTGEDEVITTDQEHFGLTGPLFATGARVVIVDADEEAIVSAVTPRTRLIATSHVLWTTGRKLDLHRVREETGLPVLVDGAQSSGALPPDVGELDFYTVSAQKWLCGPESTGALYVGDPERVRVKAPSYLSQDSYELSGEFVPKEGAKRFDSGWIPVPALRGLEAA